MWMRRRAGSEIGKEGEERSRREKGGMREGGRRVGGSREEKELESLNKKTKTVEQNE